MVAKIISNKVKDLQRKCACYLISGICSQSSIPNRARHFGEEIYFRSQVKKEEKSLPSCVRQKAWSSDWLWA